VKVAGVHSPPIILSVLPWSSLGFEEGKNTFSPKRVCFMGFSFPSTYFLQHSAQFPFPSPPNGIFLLHKNEKWNLNGKVKVYFVSSPSPLPPIAAPVCLFSRGIHLILKLIHFHFLSPLRTAGGWTRHRNSTIFPFFSTLLPHRSWSCTRAHQ